MRRQMLLVSGMLTAWLAAVAGCGPSEVGSEAQEAWNGENDPLNLDSNYQRKLEQLPLQGRLKYAPWSDAYWANKNGGVALRWKTGEQGFRYRLPTLQQVQRMTMAQKAQLSPAEKYEIYRGRYSYNLVMAERQRTRPNAPHWEGLCHGWAAASMRFIEPKPVLLKGAHGVEVPFGAADVKALLTVLYGQYARTETRSLGGRCESRLNAHPRVARRPECRDVNAGAFHIVLTNRIGLMKRGFAMDIVRDFEVWNHPVFSYSSHIRGYQAPSMGAAPGTVSEAVVETQVVYIGATNPTWHDHSRNNEKYTSTQTYRYRVELNRAKEIIGGDWLTEHRPDFLWDQGTPPLTGDWAPLEEIYKKSIASPGFADPTWR